VRLTARERYAVRAMAVLAAGYGNGPRPLPSVAADEGIPFGYLEHIAQRLRRSGLVRSTRGAFGGYELARSPEDITVADVLRAIGEGVIPADCGAAGNCYYHDRLDECVTRPIWQDIQSQVEESLSRVTLATVAKRVGANLDAERVRGDGSS